MKKALTCLALLTTGCEVTASVFVQKDWNTDCKMYKNNDLTTKAEVKVSRQFGETPKRTAQ